MGNVTGKRQKLLAKSPLICGLCGGVIEDQSDATVDHIRPRSCGGSNAIENLQLAHSRCNQVKYNNNVRCFRDNASYKHLWKGD